MISWWKLGEKNIILVALSLPVRPPRKYPEPWNDFEGEWQRKLLILGLADSKAEEEWLLQMWVGRLIQLDELNAHGSTRWGGSAPCVCGVGGEVMGNGALWWMK